MTGKDRQAKRRQALNDIAKGNGWHTWGRYETAVKNEETPILPAVPPAEYNDSRPEFYAVWAGAADNPGRDSVTLFRFGDTPDDWRQVLANSGETDPVMVDIKIRSWEKYRRIVNSLPYSMDYYAIEYSYDAAMVKILGISAEEIDRADIFSVLAEHLPPYSVYRAAMSLDVMPE